MRGSAGQEGATARGSVQCAGHALAKQTTAAKALRHRARHAYCGEATPDNTSLHLYAMAKGMRAFHARQCRICC